MHQKPDRAWDTGPHQKRIDKRQMIANEPGWSLEWDMRPANDAHTIERVHDDPEKPAHASASPLTAVSSRQLVIPVPRGL
jgi:hypothetical protein